MECNREEAVRARGMAEQKLMSQDYLLAKKYAMKAQQLFPGLENMGHMMAVIDVHLAALVKIGSSNEKDWYGILQVEPTADEAAVKKQYRKLALFLHPDKNKLVGAESAFKLIGEASQVLSDKMQRLVYNAKRGLAHTKTSQHAPVRNQRGSGVAKQNHQQTGHGAASTNAFNNSRKQNIAAARQQAQLHPFTFWTACPFCLMRYQYLRKFENQKLFCPQCRQPFVAKELSNLHQVNNRQVPPSQMGQSKPRASPTTGTAGLGGFANGCQNVPSATDSIYKGAASFPKNGSDCATKLPNGSRATEKAEVENELRRKAEEFLRSMELQKEMAKQKQVQNTKVTDFDANLPNGGKAADISEVEKEFLRKAEQFRRLMELQKEETRQNQQLKNMKVTEKNQEQSAKSKIEEQPEDATARMKGPTERVSSKSKRKRGKKQNASSGSESEEDNGNWEKKATNWKRDEHPRRSSRSKRNVTYNCNESDDDFQHVPDSKKVRVEVEAGPSPKGLNTVKTLADIAKNAIKMKLNLPKTTVSAVNEAQAVGSGTCPDGGKRPESLEKEKECLASQASTDGVSMPSCSVPDAEFHNFDRGREEKDVEVGQVWALYDDKDGMPKYYMKVKEVRSRTPFRVSVGWFEMRKPSKDLCELLDSGFSFTCGEFIMSSSQVLSSVNAFSHLVKWEKAGKGIIRVFPKKGEIWCLYEDWKRGQQLLTITDIPSKYCMVEVLTDYNEASGVTVMLLKKLEGFKLLFVSDERVLQIPSLKLLRFSHQVPAYKLKGDEAPSIPKDCWEVDPAAVPSSLVRPYATAPCEG